MHSGQTSLSNLVCAGDWVRMGDREHGRVLLIVSLPFCIVFPSCNYAFCIVVLCSGIALPLLAYPCIEGYAFILCRGSSKPPLFLISVAGAKGLCQERAYVSGLEAANALGNEGVLGRERKFRSHRVIPIREDEPQVALGRVANKQVGELGNGRREEDKLSVGVGLGVAVKRDF